MLCWCKGFRTSDDDRWELDSHEQKNKARGWDAGGSEDADTARAAAIRAALGQRRNQK
jgi:hypothetical protein